MKIGYLAQRNQLMVYVSFSHPMMTEEVSDERYEEIEHWLRSWWGGELPGESVATKHRVIALVGVLHNLICQDARLPFFDLPFIDPDTEKPSFWIPTLLGLDKKVHSLALKFALAAISSNSESACHEVLGRAVSTVNRSAGDKVLGLSDGSIPILSEAHNMGLHFYHAVDDIVQVGQGSCSRLIHVSASDADSAAGMLISENKAMMAALFERAGIPTPVTIATQSADIAPLILSKLSAPLIVKPERGARGQGVLTDITSEPLLKRAILLAIDSSPVKVALVQPQMKGHCHRVQVLNGKVMWATTRYPKSVVGDGNSTVGQLVDSANEALKEMPARQRLRPFPTDDLAVLTLKKQGFTLNSVPPDGVRIQLRPVTSVADGGDTQAITETLHPANAALCIEATKVCRLNTAGVDFFSEDPTVPWYENGGAILEVNYKPQIFNRLSDRIAKEPHKRFVSELTSGAGRLPIYAFVGEAEAKEKAIQRHEELMERGVSAWLCTDEGIAGPERMLRPRKAPNLLRDLSALMQNPRVEALCLQVGRWGEEKALPVTHVTHIDKCYPECNAPTLDDWARVSDRLRISLSSA